MNGIVKNKIKDNKKYTSKDFIDIENKLSSLVEQVSGTYKQGLILEKASSILTNKTSTLSTSSKQQAAVIEEISSIFSSNSQHIISVIKVGNDVKNFSIKGLSLAKDTDS